MTDYLYDNFAGDHLRGLDRRDLFRQWLESLGLPPYCQECRQDWVSYERKVVFERDDWSEIVREQPAYVIKRLNCKNEHHHAWVEYPDGTPMTPGPLTEHLIAQEFGDEEITYRRQHD